MKKTAIIALILLTTGVFASAASGKYDIIPKPKSLTEANGTFTFTKHTSIVSEDGAFGETIEDFAAQLRLVTGWPVSTKGPASGSDIIFTKNESLKPEAYRLKVGPDVVRIEASSSAGAFYATQTLMQLFPVQVFGDKKAKGVKWTAACCFIEDAPRFAYRGLMLDCGRYFLPKETVMKFIDIMAMHKQNIFHWHLTEDQGWRIEIKKYPRLTEVGAWRSCSEGYKGETVDPTPHGGFYSQDDVREIVEYARHRNVTVVPEIEIPGHSSAALAAYPELSCNSDSTYTVATSWGIKNDVYCPNAFTFQFLEDVFTELFELFPSPYYHIGGDECPKEAWKKSGYCQDLMKVLGLNDIEQMQTFFVNRIGNFLRQNGKTVIGWDEILDGGAVDGAIAMSYRGHAPAARGIKRGNKVVLAPNRWCYLDYYQEDPETEPKSQSLFLPLKKVYNYFPVVDSLRELSAKYIIGVEGCVWGEYDQNSKRSEYLAFPRDVALSEVGWTDRPDKDWESFRSRLEKDLKRLDEKNVNYSKAYYNVIFNYDSITQPRPQEVDFLLDYPDATIHYTTDGSEPTLESPEYSAPFKPAEGTLVRARGFDSKGKAVGVPVEKKF